MVYTQDGFRQHLRAGSPWQVELVGSVLSTMGEARRLADERPGEDFLVAVAEEQTAGLGRNGRPWASTSDGLAMTALLRSALPARNAPWFTLASAVAAAEALGEMGFPVGIKWPNDVLAADEAHWRRKLCGIRCEMQLAGEDLAWVSIGIGVNVNHEAFPENLAATAASLRQLRGERLSRTEVAGAILDKLEDVYRTLEADGFAPIRDRWLSLALGLGEEATVRDRSGETRGVVRGMDDEGHLLLELPGQPALHAVVAGDLVFEA